MWCGPYEQEMLLQSPEMLQKQSLETLQKWSPERLWKPLLIDLQLLILMNNSSVQQKWSFE